MMIPESIIRSAMITAGAYGAAKIMRPCESAVENLARADPHVFTVYPAGMHAPATPLRHWSGRPMITAGLIVEKHEGGLALSVWEGFDAPEVPGVERVS